MNMEESDAEEISGSSSSTGELLPIEDNCGNHFVFNYTDPDLHSGIIKAIINNDLEKVQELVSQGKNVRNNDNNGNTPIHIAVLACNGNLDIIKYLLELEDVNTDEINFLGHTPLFLSTYITHNEDAARLLLKAGADVNISSNDGVTPLHQSVRFSQKLSEDLIMAGADINSIDYNGDTPLHDAVVFGDLEVVCMLLYYNADTTIQNSGGLTPFMQSLATNNLEYAEVLFDYETDFNLVTTENMSTLFLAITSSFPRIIDMIKRGADVNYTNQRYNVFTLGVSLSVTDFQFIWNLIDYKKVFITSVLLYIREQEQRTPESREIILRSIFEDTNSQRTKDLADDSQKHPLIFILVNEFFSLNLPHETVYSWCTNLLQYNVIVYDIDLDMVFERYGYCDLFKLLFYMDIQFTNIPRSLRFNIFPSMVYNFKDTIYSRIILAIMHSTTDEFLEHIDLENLLDHIIYPRIRWNIRLITSKIDNSKYKQVILDYVDSLQTVPKLTEMAAIEARHYLVKTYNVQRSCHFYTILNHLEIPLSVKKLISLETPIYRKSASLEFISRIKRWKLREDRIIRLLSSCFSEYFVTSEIR